MVLQTQRPGAESVRPSRFFAWVGMGVLTLVAAAGLVAGTTAVWSAFDPSTPGQSPAPLWFPPPATVHPKPAAVTTTPDDHGGRRETPTTTPSSTSRTTEPGDDKGGGKGKSSDDGSSHGKGHN
ncbi:MAG: hypothetical protein QOH84_379 [Kribbellaceae bacterium]|nr:hypothetical protein [Kribbellaceae bacterium]